MAINFPTSPVLNQEYTFDTRTWIWNGAAWSLKQGQPSNLLDLIKTVDGTGSGLDADLVDGTHASSFYLASNPSGYTNNTGTVTSVSGTGTAGGLTLSGTVTGSGSLTLGGTLSVTPSNFAFQVANTVLAAPNGATGTPTFRSLVAADIPTLNQNTTGSAATLTTGRTIGMTGDVTWTSASFNGSANVTGTATLANSGVTANTYGSSSSIPVITVNAKGLVTSVTTSAVSGGQYFGTAATKAIAYNSNTVGENITITTGNNALSAGPITVSSGFTVTVQSGAVWTIV